MNAQQSKALSLIAQALNELAGGNPAMNSDVTLAGGGHAMGNRLNEIAPPAQQGEIDREVARLGRANEKLGQAVERAWKRLNTVTFPPAPSEASCSMAIESCGSTLGNALQCEATRIESQASSLHYLLDSLAV